MPPDGRFDFWGATYHRGYTIYPVIKKDRTLFVAMHGSETWWEADSRAELCRLIDDALDN